MTKPCPMVPLGEVLTHRKEFIQIDDAAIYKRCRVKLHAQGIVLRDEVPGIEIKTKKQQVCKTGELLVAEIDAKVGGFGIVPDYLESSIVSSHYFLFQINESRLNRKFLDYFIRTPDFRDQVSAQGSTNYAAIRPKEVLGYKIPLPPLSEQKRIVARVEELAAKIEEAKRLRQKAVEEAEALLPAALRYIFCLKEPKIQLGETLQLQRGFDLPVQQRISGKYPIFAANGEIGRHNEARVKGPGVVTGRSGSIGAVKYVQEDYWPLNTSLYVRDFKSNNPRLIYYLLRAISTDLRQASSHTAVPTLDRKKAHTQIWVHVPPLPEQRHIVAYLDNLQAKVDAVKELQAGTAGELDAMLPSVLDKAFKGEM